MKTVLLTNAQQRKTLAVARSLGKRGVKVIIAEETRFNPAAFSKYCTKALVYPSPKRKPKEYYEWLKKTITQYDCEMVFPMDEDTLDIAMDNYQELSALCHIPIINKKSYKIAKDKGQATELAKNLGVDCPWTMEVKEINGIKALSEKIVYPIVIKPKDSSGSRGIKVIYNSQDFLRYYIQIHEVYPFPVVQEYIGKGQRYDVCLLLDKEGNLKASFAQKELRHFPVDIGPSTLQESVHYPEIIQSSLKMAQELGWYGVIEFEYMIDERDGKPKFLEINPRFWGSLQLAICSGIDFPWLLYCTAKDEVIDTYFKYESGIRCRWLLPGDICHFIANKDRLKMSPPFFAGKKYNIKDDILSMEDPLPALGFFLACMRYVLDIHMWKFFIKR
jgi:predicted ATP-grasp superfamily ATP-dependent carboligase